MGFGCYYGMLLVVLVVLGQSDEVLGNTGYPLRGHDSGTCKVYPETGGICSHVLGGLKVFEWEGISLEDYGTTMKTYYEDIYTQTQSIATKVCLDTYTQMLCLSWFPLCTEDDEPRRICNSFCSYLNDDACASAFLVADGIGQGAKIPKCSRMVGAADTGFANVYYEYYNPWKDTLMFPSVETDPTCADIDATTVQDTCEPKQCPKPFVEYRIPRFLNESKGVPVWKNPEDYEFCRDSLGQPLDCERCESWCAMECGPYPEVYPDSTYSLMHLGTYLPGLIAGPLNILVVFSEFKKLKALKKKDFTDYLILISAVLSIALTLFQALPSAILGKEMRCNNAKTYAWEHNVQAEHDYCKFGGKLTVHLLQSLLFCVVGTLFKVLRQLQSSLRMARYTMSAGTKNLFVVLVVILPTVLATLTLFLDSDQLLEMSLTYRVANGLPTTFESLQTANRLRYAYTCGPRFADTNTEMLIIHYPMLIAGIASVILSSLLLHIVICKMGAISLKRSKHKSSNNNNDALTKLAMNMIRFAFVTTLLVIINITVTFEFVPKAIEFGTQMDFWEDCAVTGVDWLSVPQDENGKYVGDISLYTNKNKTFEANLEHCGRFEKFSPDPTLLVVLAFSQGLPSLAFGFIFALPALRQLSQSATSRFGKVNPSSGTTAAANATTATSIIPPSEKQ